MIAAGSMVGDASTAADSLVAAPEQYQHHGEQSLHSARDRVIQTSRGGSRAGGRLWCEVKLGHAAVAVVHQQTHNETVDFILTASRKDCSIHIGGP